MPCQEASFIYSSTHDWKPIDVEYMTTTHGHLICNQRECKKCGVVEVAVPQHVTWKRLKEEE